MSKVINFAFFFILASHSNAWAEDNIVGLVSAVDEFQACYENTTVETAAETCNFIKNCIDESRENSTSVGMLNCAQKGYELWDAKLNIEYKTLRSLVVQSHGNDAKIALRDSQRAWLKYREAECDAKYQRQDLRVGGAYYSCFARLTASKTLDFKSDNQWFLSKGYKVSE